MAQRGWKKYLVVNFRPPSVPMSEHDHFYVKKKLDSFSILTADRPGGQAPVVPAEVGGQRERSPLPGPRLGGGGGGHVDAVEAARLATDVSVTAANAGLYNDCAMFA